jgi:threonine/homoserine/homoserine lactone efflux protein
MTAILGTHDLAVFVVSGLLLNVAPGPDTLYIVGRSASQGFRGGAIAALGINAGCFVHIGAAALGLSALLAASATAFTLLKWVGGAYLVWIGISMLRAPASNDAARNAPPLQSLRRVFAQGLATNALNPKVALFFLAFLPQFIDPDAPHKALAFLFLGCVFNVNSMLWNGFVAWSTARIANGVARWRAARTWVNRAIGGVFVVLGLRLAAIAS